MAVDLVVIAIFFDLLMEAGGCSWLVTHAFTIPPSMLIQNCAFLIIFLASFVTAGAALFRHCRSHSVAECPDGTDIGIIHFGGHAAAGGTSSKLREGQGEHVDVFVPARSIPGPHTPFESTQADERRRGKTSPREGREPVVSFFQKKRRCMARLQCEADVTVAVLGGSTNKGTWLYSFGCDEPVMKAFSCCWMACGASDIIGEAGRHMSYGTTVKFEKQ
ncbi:hypothetical protein B0H14DRAFT_2603718 [Mycena olivaceomarginata]|nr:hypothetical protein B0H14DRAFT_2603718 [Mycena olivaceomarginata]